MTELTIESFTGLLVPMLVLLGIGVLWLVVRGVIRLTMRTLMLGCGMVFGLGVAWALVLFMR